MGVIARIVLGVGAGLLACHLVTSRGSTRSRRGRQRSRSWAHR
jgi:hypothetical protein